MARAGSHLAWGLVLAVFVMGCRTPQPELKPGPQPEVLTVAPKEPRYNQSQFPDLAFRDMNNQFRKPLDGNGGILPARGMSAAPGMSPGGGMGPGGMGSGGFR